MQDLVEYCFRELLNILRMKKDPDEIKVCIGILWTLSVSWYFHFTFINPYIKYHQASR